MAHTGESPFGSRVKPADTELATQQWAQWRASRRRFLGQAGAAAGALALTGSVFAGQPQAVAALVQDDTPVMGGSVSMSLADDDVASFDPIVPFDNMSIWTMLLIYDQLIRVGPDGLSLEGGAAETWDVSDDNLTYTFHLRKTNFHDGTPFTSADAEFCINRVIQPDDSGWAFLFSAVDTVKATDESTLVITLKQAWAPFEADLALYGASIFPKAAYEAQGEDLWQHPIGTGPFMFDSWDKGSQMVLKKNPTYWDEGKPYLDEVVFKVLTDSNARLLQLQGGELDIATDVPFNQIEPLSANPDFNLVPDAVAKIVYMGFNLKREFAQDKNLRRTPEAMAQGLHRFARGHSFYESGKHLAKVLGVPLGWQLATAPGVGHSWAYLPDVAETMARLADREATLGVFENFHFRGHWDHDGEQMIAAIRRAAGDLKLPVRRFPWLLATLASPFLTFFREVREMRYLWREPLQLDNGYLRAALGEEPHTPLDEAVRATLVGLGCLPPQSARSPHAKIASALA